MLQLLYEYGILEFMLRKMIRVGFAYLTHHAGRTLRRVCISESFWNYSFGVLDRQISPLGAILHDMINAKMNLCFKRQFSEASPEASSCDDISSMMEDSTFHCRRDVHILPNSMLDIH